jgi:hypothetical protein
MTKLLYLLPISLMFLACQKLDIETAEFSSSQWKSDRLGCKGSRLALKNGISGIQELIKGKPESQVVEILGKPDRVDLFKRGQKFFVYWLNNPECKADSLQPNIYTEIRFNSIDIASELSVVQTNNR